MKNRKTNKNGNGHVQTIRIEFNDAVAGTVAIAGTFNDWRPEVTPMLQVGAGRWVKDLALPPGTYEYLLVADGKWLPDPSTKATVPNPFGGVNSLLTVPYHCNGRGAKENPSSKKICAPASELAHEIQLNP